MTRYPCPYLGDEVELSDVTKKIAEGDEEWKRN